MKQKKANVEGGPLAKPFRPDKACNMQRETVSVCVCVGESRTRARTVHRAPFIPTRPPISEDTRYLQNAK